MDPNDPNGYEEKKMKKHIQMLELWDDGDYGIMTWCPCGEPLTEEVIEGTIYYTCGQYKYDSFFHVRKRWDKAIGQEVVRLKEESAEQARKIHDLGFQLEITKRQAIGEEVVKLKEENAEQAKKICDLGIQLEESKNEIAQLWDTVRFQICGCESCKDEVAKNVCCLSRQLCQCVPEIQLCRFYVDNYVAFMFEVLC